MNWYRFSKLGKFIAFSFFVIMTISCEEDSDLNEITSLEVYVSGTLSGNPRSGLKVVLYATREDAEIEVNALSNIQTTNSDGIAFFDYLESGIRYFVRVDTTLIYNIKLSDPLKTGTNRKNMSIL